MKKTVLYTKFLIVLWLVTASRSEAGTLRDERVAEAHASASSASLKADGARILKAIDDVCGDSWCEGAFDFHFQKVLLKPAQNETQILFRMSQEYPVRLDEQEGASFQAQINQRFYDVSCVLPGYASYDSIMQSTYFLRGEFYTALSQCISSLEDQLMQVTKSVSP